MTNISITAPKGFLAAGVHCGIKQSGKPDLAIVYCPTGAAAAAMFTTNAIQAASVAVCRQHIASKKIYAAVINSGNANACTGTKGLAAAEAICRKTASQLQIAPQQVLIASTGIIGHQLPLSKITSGIASAASQLRADSAGGLAFAKAIMTTDTRCKQAMRTVKIGGKTIAIAGTAKGAGMIGPNMATTISVITTDAAITKILLDKALRNAVGLSLNRLTVDGHQSTNDTAMILASGLAENKTIKKQDIGYRRFSAALADLCSDLAKQMALDAEGATRMFKVEIKEAATKEDAFKAARAVADYDLVKCAIHGGDPNWGRIICAVGSCGVKLNPNRLSCKIGDIYVFRNGKPTNFDSKKVSKIISRKEHTITVYLGSGRHNDFCYGCDLSRDYVTINADYHT
ncbi:MAG TPA: bifunctional glutamate N-acetyltransferase/amino-acid acetyltransferase ArgJ [Anaerohalosphaeraceae bacterium]|nr:bifunctional glutamate N-acetyltransferase/amino-acid acetyltransferase ArgJ [Anaerohalosphaeraceae bacterium]HOM75250.1 bifunctional glutamate N-acetyltransferase/amino-acid acetyltransferase ArgJ [Anaerohalosphaeraceae bacterium]HPC64517.1 bifunctional glutamate N-acetyltransferase/amino-acid acetyltransferase ArgJ [Anaerohalosphaeraceae bacterium]HPO69438.1 bifunctional glutamate N-acetyltransferase/amino-acid acetyltransferase ArgJ [Anaerohalosphaeraceae bacterium]HRS71515.1 bifunctional